MMPENVIHEQIKFPDFNNIIMDCKVLMSLKFPQYKNSWVGKKFTYGTQALPDANEFWKERLMGEVEEFLKANTAEQARKELCDIINVCSMIHENCEQVYDKFWRYG